MNELDAVRSRWNVLRDLLIVASEKYERTGRIADWMESRDAMADLLRYEAQIYALFDYVQGETVQEFFRRVIGDGKKKNL